MVKHPEPGTLGAALLAGLAIGVYDQIEEVSTLYSGTEQVYLPDTSRAALHQERFEKYRKIMQLLLDNIY